MRLGLRGRIGLMVLAALVPPTAVAIALELTERQEAREQALKEVTDTTELVRADVERGLESTARFLAAFSRDLAGPPYRAGCERVLELVPRSTRKYSAVGAALPDGTVYCGATQQGVTRHPTAHNVSGAGWFRAAQARRGFVLGEYGPDPLSGTGALVAARPIPGPPGRPPSIMFAAIDARSFSEATALKDAPRGTTFVLIDDRGTLLGAVPAMDERIGRPLRDRALAHTLLTQRRGTADVVGPDGVKRIQAFDPVGGPAGTQLLVAAGREASSVFADVDRDLRRFIALGLVGLVLALVFSALATKVLLQRWTSDVVGAARRFGAGDLTARAPVPRSFAELGDVATALNSAAEEIEHRQGEQERLLAELVAVEEETRRRIAADIHDDTAQAVAAAGLRIDALIGELSDPGAREAAIEARKALGEANRRLRRLLFELRPPALDEAGLAAALELYLSDPFNQDGFVWRMDNRLTAEPSPESRAVLYRVALEALTNVRKHARAGTVDVRLEWRGAGVAVRIHDDGDGFELPSPDASSRAGHIGLVSMRERAEAAGGRFSLTTAPGRGTTVDFWMPEPNGRR
jgi:signal transduction histidine kinase